MLATSSSTPPTRVWLKRLRAKYIFLSSGSHQRIVGERNRVRLHDSLLHHCTIELIGEGNTLEIFSGARLWDVTLRLVGKGLSCQIGAHSRLHGGHFILEDEGSRLEIGTGCTFYSPMCVVNEGGKIQIGDDSMVAYGTDLRNSDGHSILDANTRKRINPARDIVLQNRVWIGAQSQILKGVTIGTSAIVAARSVVTKDVSAGTLVGGVPTRVIRENVDWDGRRL